MIDTTGLELTLSALAPLYIDTFEVGVFHLGNDTGLLHYPRASLPLKEQMQFQCIQILSVSTLDGTDPFMVPVILNKYPGASIEAETCNCKVTCMAP